MKFFRFFHLHETTKFKILFCIVIILLLLIVLKLYLFNPTNVNIQEIGGRKLDWGDLKEPIKVEIIR